MASISSTSTPVRAANASTASIEAWVNRQVG
jgi:hypothetical protein